MRFNEDNNMTRNELTNIDANIRAAELGKETLFNEMRRIGNALGMYTGNAKYGFDSLTDYFSFEDDHIYLGRCDYDDINFDINIKYEWFEFTDEQLAELKERLERDEKLKRKIEKINDLKNQIKNKEKDINRYKKELKELS